ncbi:MAG: TRAP transporter substrate-binding protein [bacterium]|nr:TRAP transporter substrate-binding protein [bacterium]
MKKLKVSISLACILAMIVSLTGCAATTADGKKQEVWNVAVIQTEDHPQTMAVKKFGEIFSELTDGRYKIEVYPNELLGPQRETLEQVQYGIIEMAVIGNANISSFVDGFLTFEMPFLFDDEDHQKRFFENSTELNSLFTQTEKYNFKIASQFTAGTRNMYANKAIKGLADLKGMKIRTAESDTYIKMMKCLGGAATPMSFGEVFTAIQSGVVDGAENNEASYSNTKHYEIAPYYSYTKHLIVPDYMIVNNDLYNSLSEEDKAAFEEASTRAREYEYELWQKETATYLQNVIDAGAKIVEDVDVNSLKAAVQPLHEELTKNEAVKVIYDAVKKEAN